MVGVSTLPPETMEEFKELTEDDVKSLIQRSSSKSCSLDPIPSKLLPQCDVFLPVITSLINMSLRTGVVPRVWKEALITPLLKKPGADMHVPQNFRPVSNLSKMSKLTETAVCHQIQNHLLEHNIYPDQQSAYRKNFSTETLLLKVKNDLLMNMNKQHVTLLVLLDLSAAFDTIDHKMLIDRLKIRCGITNVPLRWFESYLENRSQRVVVNGAESRSFDLQFGLAQGSCLGPLLFTIYTGELSDIIKPHLPAVMCYADDTQLYVSFSPKDNCGEVEAIAAMERCIKDIQKWMKESKLQLNTDKTELLLIGTKQQLQKINMSTLCVGNDLIKPSKEVKNLGVWLDPSLTMNTHINKTCSIAFHHLYNLRRIRKYLSQESVEVLIHSLIYSRIDYCNSLYLGLPDYQIQKIQRVQNAAARLAYNAGKYCHITPLLFKLHWLPIRERILFKILLITYKAVHGHAPNYIKELIKFKKPGKYNLRSNSDNLLLEIEKLKTYTTLGDRAFQVAAPKLWNNLPFNIRSSLFLPSFKKALKTYLFREAFP